MALADDRVRLPVADPLLRLHDLRALGDVRAVRDAAPARVAPALPVRLLPAAPQEKEEPAPGLPVGADVLVDPFPARHGDALLAEAAGGPVRAPALRQPVLRRRPPLRRHLPGNGRRRAAPRRGLALRLQVPVSAPAAVAPDLAPDSRPVPADLPGNGQVGQSAFPQRVYLASFAMGQVVVAARHDSLHASSQGLSPPSGRFATSCVEGRRSPPHPVLPSEWHGGFLCFCGCSLRWSGRSGGEEILRRWANRKGQHAGVP